MILIINSIIPIFILIFLGWLCTRIKLFNKEQSSALNNYAYYIAMPVLIFQTLSKMDIKSIWQSNFVLVNILAVLVVIILVYILGKVFKINRQTLGVFIVGCFLGNVAFIGIPFHSLLLGKDGVAYSSISAALITFLASTIGIYLIEKGLVSKEVSLRKKINNLIKIIFKPMVFSVLLAVAFSFLKINLPSVVTKVLDIISSSTTAVSLFAVGIFIYGNSIKERFSLTLALTIGSLVVMPFVAWVMTWFFPLGKTEMITTVLQAAMPLATMNFILAHQYKIEEKLIANAILLSTVLSAVTLPVWIWIIS